MSNRSSSSPAALRVELTPSRRLRAALILVGALALAAVARAALPVPLRLVLAAAVLAEVLLLLRRHTGLWGGRACSGLVWDGAGWLWLCGAEARPALLRRATLWPGLLLLDFRCEGSRRPHPVLLLPDSAAADDLRRLRVYLRHLPVFSG